MRARPSHSFSERHTLRHRLARHAAPSVRAHLRLAPDPPAPADEPAAPAADELAGSATDLALRRVREAGGPIDSACYSCSCGYVFDAPVSTSVTCPVCQASQAW
jgi:hypothetical protein